MGTRDALVIGYGEDRGMNTLNEDQTKGHKKKHIRATPERCTRKL
jgi:hypothetical protein